MATITKRGDKYNVQVRVKGRFSSKTFSTKTEAKAWGALEEHRVSRTKGVLKGKSLGEAFRKYREEESPKKKGARWEDRLILALEKDEIANIQLSDLCAEDFKAWVKRQEGTGVKSSTIRRRMLVISVILSTARGEWVWLDGNPMENVKIPKTLAPRDKLIEEEEIIDILAALKYEEDAPVRSIRQKIAVAFLLALETAMRQGEIWKMEWKDINWKKCYVQLWDTKNGEDRKVPLSKKALKLLQSLEPAVNGRVFNFNQGSSGVIFRRAVELAGHKGKLTFHDARHYATTYLAEKLDILTLARVTGHKDTRSLMGYFNPKTEDIAKKLG